MYELNKFNALCSSKGISKKSLSEKTAIPLARMYRKQKEGSFTYEEIVKLCLVLGKDEVLEVFFGKEVA